MFRALLFLCGVKLMLQEKPSLSPEYAVVMENSTLELICSAYTDATITRWGTIDLAGSFSYLNVLTDGKCKINGFLSETKYYETECYRNGTFKVKIKRVSNSYHGQVWYCSHMYTESNPAYIYVKVPTKSISFENMSGNIINAVEKINASLICKTSEGRPAANITWTKVSKKGTRTDLTHSASYRISRQETNSDRKLIIVQSTIDFEPLREDNGSIIICEVRNVNESREVRKEATIKVQYPPSRPIFLINESQVNASLTIVAGSNVSVLCKSDSYPCPVYNWSSATDHYIGQYLNVSKFARSDTWQCTVTNYMTLQNKTMIYGENSEKLKIHVMCTPIASPDFHLQPNISSAQNMTVMFQFKALAYPTPQFHWFKLKGSSWKSLQNGSKYQVRTSENNSNLSISAVSEDDYGYFKLFIQNTVGSFEQLYLLKENDSQSKVHFMLSEKALDGIKYKVNESEEISFVCYTDSDIPTDLVISKQEGEKITLFKNTTFARQTIHEVSCDDAGEYKCSAINMLTLQHETMSKFVLIVKCPPMPSTKYKVEGTFLSKLHSDVTMQFIVRDYFDDANNTVFIWYKRNISLPNDGSKYIISTNGFQSALVIRNITVSDFGQYRVFVQNSYGYLAHTFELQWKNTTKEKESSLLKIMHGVAIGTLMLTIIVVVLVFIYCRRLRRQMTDSGPNQSGFIQELNRTSTCNDDNAAHYAEIDDMYERVNEQLMGGAVYMEMRSTHSEDSTKYYITPTI